MNIIKSALVAFSMLVSITAWAEPVNINIADAKTIQKALSGIGKVRADAIIEYREKHGPFEFVDDIMNVDGIGRMTLEQNRDNILLK